MKEVINLLNTYTQTNKQGMAPSIREFITKGTENWFLFRQVVNMGRKDIMQENANHKEHMIRCMQAWKQRMGRVLSMNSIRQLRE